MINSDQAELSPKDRLKDYVTKGDIGSSLYAEEYCRKKNEEGSSGGNEPVCWASCCLLPIARSKWHEPRSLDGVYLIPTLIDTHLCAFILQATAESILMDQILQILRYFDLMSLWKNSNSLMYMFTITYIYARSNHSFLFELLHLNWKDIKASQHNGVRWAFGKTYRFSLLRDCAEAWCCCSEGRCQSGSILDEQITVADLQIFFIGIVSTPSSF